MPYIGKQPLAGQFKKLDAITVVNNQAAYTMQYNSSNFKPATAEQLICSVNGVVQAAGDAYTVSGSTITFSENLVTGDVIDFIVALGEVGNTVTPVDGSVDINKMSSSLMTESGGSTTFKVDNIQNSSGTDAVSIDSSGNVGIGTSSPSSDATLHLASGSSNKPHMLLENTVSSGGDPGITFADSVENYGYRIGADDTGNAFVITYKSGGTNPIHGTDSERMRITNDGKIIIGRNSSFAGGLLQVKKEGGASLSSWDESNSGTRTHVEFLDSTSGSARGSITTNGSSTSYNTSSDYRLKENSVDLTGAITRVKSLQPKRFNFISDTTDTLVDGFMAHETATVVPEAVTGTHNEVDADGNPVYQSIDQAKLVPLLTAALQEAIAKIETLETKVTALENA